MLKIKYITNVRIPSVRAQSYAIMKMCESFANFGNEVELIVPKRINSEIKEDPFVYHGIHRNFSIRKIPSLDFLGTYLALGKIFYWLDIFSFFINLVLVKAVSSSDVVYTRDFLVALFFGRKHKVFLEIHDLPKSKFLFKKALNKSVCVFVLTKYIKSEIVAMGISEGKIYVFPSGVNIEDFDVVIPKEDARKKVGLPLDAKIVVYTGHFYKWKGVDTLAMTAKIMPETTFVFVGGVDPELSEFRDRYLSISNIIVKPFVDKSLVALYLKSADVLVLPNSSKDDISRMYTSPLKMLEYMASGVPMVASDLPSLREVLNESLCEFASPDDPDSFRVSINKVLQNPDLSVSISSRAKEEVKKYTWKNRATDISSIIADFYK